MPLRELRFYKHVQVIRSGIARGEAEEGGRSRGGRWRKRWGHDGQKSCKNEKKNETVFTEEPYISFGEGPDQNVTL